MRRLRHSHRVGVRHGRGLAYRRSHVILGTSTFTRDQRSSTTNSAAGAVRRMVEQSTDVVHKERVEFLSDLFLVGKFQSTVERNPNSLQMHRTNLDHVSVLLALENTVATTARHTSHVKQFGSVDHVVVFASSHANAVGLNLEAKTSLVFPERGSHSRLHARRRDLSCCVKCSTRILALC